MEDGQNLSVWLWFFCLSLSSLGLSLCQCLFLSLSFPFFAISFFLSKRQREGRRFAYNTNGVFSLKWRLTDRYLRRGTLAGLRPGRADANQCKSSDFLQELRISGLPRF